MLKIFFIDYPHMYTYSSNLLSLIIKYRRYDFKIVTNFWQPNQFCNKSVINYLKYIENIRYLIRITYLVSQMSTNKHSVYRALSIILAH